MDTVNTASLRDQLQAYQESFKDLCRKDKVGPEWETLVRGILLLMKQVVTVVLENNTGYSPTRGLRLLIMYGIVSPLRRRQSTLPFNTQHSTSTSTSVGTGLGQCFAIVDDT